MCVVAVTVAIAAVAEGIINILSSILIKRAAIGLPFFYFSMRLTWVAK